ncbi:Sin3 associated polypeptide p18-like protein [Plasmodium coatneyi]|uniref:Sin3 associated polypeptide p18-like protein n=1 Tax=Plasmodium coatneyi TaxID=208452 RepID=A0A1B1DTB0_9APIC|nr:Sin3 associated polypeptide p18-like protein [Plasmodium coatneyi]ANQ05837.1 Sin3 associated polypeptide p18-like protein [Plasmodium coatneyi]
MSSSEKSSVLENDKGDDTQSGDGEENLVEPSEGGSERDGERDKRSNKGKSREEYKRRKKEDASEKSYRSSMSLLSAGDIGKTGDRKRKREKKRDKKSSSHRVKRNKDRGEKRRRRSSDSHGRSDSSGESSYSRHSRERKERKRKKEVKRKGKHKLGEGEGRYSKLSSFSLSSSYTDADMDLESISDLNYKHHSDKRKKKIQKKVSSDYLSSRNHHHRYDEDKGGKRKGSANYTYKHNSRVEHVRDKFNNPKYHNWRGNSGESPSEEHHNYHHDDGRSPLRKRHSHRGSTKGHTDTLGGDERRRVEKNKKKIKKESRAYKANRNGRRSDADGYESTTDSYSDEVQSRSNHVPTRKKRRPYLSDAESADLAVSIRSDERYRAKGRMAHYGTVMVRSRREGTGGRRGEDGIHHNHDEGDDPFLHPRFKRGDPFMGGRPRMTEEQEEVPRFRDREWQPYGGTHPREFERKIYIEREDRMERPSYRQMMPPYRYHKYDQAEHKKDVAILTNHRRHEYYQEHGSNRFDEGRIPNGMIDREKTCPFLLRLFYKLDDEYNDVEDVKLCKESGVQSNELQIYAWLDITMREIVTLVKDFYQESRKRDAHWVFKVYSNEKKELTFLSRVHSTKYNYREDNKTLLSLDYEIGDILLLSIMFDRQAA